MTISSRCSPTLRSMKFLRKSWLILAMGYCVLPAAAQDLSPLQLPSLDALPDSLHKRPLTELADIFATDKRASWHNFIELYDRYLTPMQDSIHRVFEIGIFNGASHKMWKCFFDSAEIYGIDIKPKPWVEKLGIHTYIANQAKREDLQQFILESGGEFDVIIDDGGHYMNHQQISLGYLFEHLAPGGLYIIEDVHTSLRTFYNGFGVDSTGSNTTFNMIMQYIRTEKMESNYMTPEEKKYLEQNIEYVELYKRKNSLHSTACVIRKKRKSGTGILREGQ